MTSVATYAKVKKVGIIPTIRASDPARAVQAAEAILSGGLTVLEVSLALPGSESALKAVVRELGHQMVVGAGSVVGRELATIAAESGAQFIVTPGFCPETVEIARKHGIAVFAGALTPTEVQLASQSGATAVKIYPCHSMGGARYVKALKSQYPYVELIASGGISLDNCAEYFHAGACAIGVGADIADEKSIESGTFRLFVERSRRFRKAVHDARARWTLEEPAANVS